MLKKAAVALVAAVSAASCSARGPSGPAEHQTYVYTCCVASDISRPLQPGQTLTVHWIVQPGPLSGQPKATKITLEASLTGPYQSVASLKSASPVRGKVTFTARPVATTDWARGHPVLKIAIPAAAAAGLYNLTTSVVSPGGSSRGGSIVRVAAAG